MNHQLVLDDLPVSQRNAIFEPFVTRFLAPFMLKAQALLPGLFSAFGLFLSPSLHAQNLFRPSSIFPIGNRRESDRGPASERTGHGDGEGREGGQRLVGRMKEKSFEADPRHDHFIVGPFIHPSILSVRASVRRRRRLSSNRNLGQS